MNSQRLWEFPNPVGIRETSNHRSDAARAPHSLHPARVLPAPLTVGASPADISWATRDPLPRHRAFRHDRSIGYRAVFALACTAGRLRCRRLIGGRWRCSAAHLPAGTHRKRARDNYQQLQASIRRHRIPPLRSTPEPASK
jgi:hypothetical protein